jgi:hypothetical protein
VYVTDENYMVIDSLFEDDLLILPPALNEDDSIVATEEFSKAAELTKEKIDKIRPSKYLISRAFINTADAENDCYAKFYSDYYLDFKIKATVDLRINSRDL